MVWCWPPALVQEPRQVQLRLRVRPAWQGRVQGFGVRVVVMFSVCLMSQPDADRGGWHVVTQHADAGGVSSADDLYWCDIMRHLRFGASPVLEWSSVHICNSMEAADLRI